LYQNNITEAKLHKKGTKLMTMDLFSNDTANPINILPQDGTVHYYGNFLTRTEADYFFKCLHAGIEWKHDEVIIFGKQITTKRKVAWYGDAGIAYKYSGITKNALPWTDELLALKKIAEAKSGETFNSCLLNLYHNGTEGMAWHTDAEKELKKNGAISSVSLGAERRFMFKHKISGQTVAAMLGHGSLLLMKDITQTHWLHRLPPAAKITTPRINLTFRTIVTQK
jgi:alkylated DNA repair dioxygenase AlkB